MRVHAGRRRVETTLGELIGALSDAAFELCENRTRAYALASLALEEMLKKAHLERPRWREFQPNPPAREALPLVRAWSLRP